MPTIPTHRPPHADETPGEDEQHRNWRVPCSDAFGRVDELSITADRSASPSGGIGVKAPTGEYAFVGVDDANEFLRALRQATAFVNGRWALC